VAAIVPVLGVNVTSSENLELAIFNLKLGKTFLIPL